MRNLWRSLLGLVLVSTAISGNSLLGAENHWIQPNGGNWSDTNNWSLGSVPTTFDDVVIDEPGNYVVELDANVAVKSILLGGTNTTATMALDSFTLAAPTVTIEPGATFQLNAGSFDVPIVYVRGVFEWSNGTIDVSPSFYCHVQSSGLLNFVAESSSFNLPGTLLNQGTVKWTGLGSLSSSGGADIINGGTFIVQGSCALSGLGSFSNTGTISGSPLGFDTLDFATWSVDNSGVVTSASPTSTLSLKGYEVGLNDGTVFSGPGMIRLESGSFVGSGTVIVDGAVELAGANISGQHVFTGAAGRLDWTAGGFAGGSTVFAPGFNVFAIGASSKWINSHSVTNEGTLTWNSEGELESSVSGLFHNKGTFVLAGNCNMNSSGTFENTGVIKTSENAFAILRSGGWTFKNSGTFLAELNSVLSMTEGEFSFDEGTTFNGAGMTRLMGLYSFFGGNGTITVNGAVELAGGSLTGTHTWTGPGRLDWSAGGFDGGGSTEFSPGFNVHAIGNDSKWISYHNVTNKGTLTWNSEGHLNSSGFGTLHNAGAFVLSGNCNMDSAGTFENTGVIKTSENAFAILRSGGWTFKNSGTFLAELNSVLSMTEGEFSFNEGTTFNGAGMTRLMGLYSFFGGNGTITVNGAVELAGGSLTGTHTWTGPGRLNWSAGGFEGGGSTEFSPGFNVYAIENDAKWISYHSVTNKGTLTWNSEGELESSGFGLLHNAGTFVLSGNCNMDSSGTFENTGVIKTSENAFAILRSGGWTFKNSGTFLAELNSVLSMTEGEFSLNEGTTFNGAGMTRLMGLYSFFGGNGTITVNGSVELAGGSLTGTHTWTGPGRLDWSAGGFEGGGSTEFSPGFNVHAIGNDSKWISYHSVTNKGTLTWNSEGELESSGFGLLHNAGTFVLSGNCNMESSGTFENTGVIKTSENAFAILRSGGWTFKNSGTFLAELNSVLSMTEGEFSLNEGTTFNGAGITRLMGLYSFFGGNGTITVNGAVELAGGSLTGTHTWTGPGRLDWSAGGFEGGGSTEFNPGFTVYAIGNDSKWISYHSVTNKGALTWNSSGQLESSAFGLLHNGGIVAFDANSTLTGSGLLQNQGTIDHKGGQINLGWEFQNSGLLNIAGGTFNIAGSYNPLPGAVHQFVVSGVSPSVGYGQLSAGDFNFAAQLNLVLGDGFVPAHGDSFQLINYLGYNGAFSVINFPDTENWEHEYQASSFLVTFDDSDEVPVIVTGPESQTVNPGATVEFSVTVTGAEPLSYQWQFNNADIADATASILTLTNVQSTNAGVYAVVVTNNAGSVSSSAVLTVRQAPSIIVQPADQTVNLTSNATFSVEATGDGPLIYQWYFDGAIVPGATSTSFTRSDVTSGQEGEYYVVITNLAGAVTSDVATLTIAYDESPFFAAAGVYNGLFYESGEIRHESAGYLTLKVRTNAAFSGKLLVDGNALSFSGKFAANGTTNKTVLRNKFGKGSLLLDLQLDFGADQLLGLISATNWTANLLADRTVFNNTNVPATNFLGKYTMLIPGAEDQSLAPGDYGYGLVNVRTNGKVSLSGLLSDRQTAKQGTFISSSGQWPFFAPLYKGISTFHNGSKWITNNETQGSIIGWLALTNSAASGLRGTVNWTKKAWTNNLYSGGFTNEGDILGSVFTPITKLNKGTRLLTTTNGIATFAGGNLTEEVAHSFTLRTNNTFLTTSSTNLRVSVSAASGVMKGSFRDPASGTQVPFYGAILQEQNFGGGFFLGTNESGTVLLEKVE